ncbi:hypothetical protein E4T44_05980 [Aureobasidium sp. EXF-8845]|nr:hypothetical protein E4T44_05980 [Aureobasidium sp. EXF-8845]KAI4849571.1 hypothetical protein E4T45_05858 [Aureobasidium sp. EXF-8846]
MPLNLSDEPATPPLKHLFLDKSDDADESLGLWTDFVNGRLEEGYSEAMFDLGLEDNGDSMNLDKNDWDFAHVGGDDEVDVSPKEKACSGNLMIRRRPNSVDNVWRWPWPARVNRFRHKHEIENRRTSSVGMEIMGFDGKGGVFIASTVGRKLSYETRSATDRYTEVIAFSDLAGHECYIRTTVFSMLSNELNYCLLMVTANNGLIGTSQEHLGNALALIAPVMLCIAKIDICPPHILQQTITELTEFSKTPGARKISIKSGVVRAGDTVLVDPDRFGDITTTSIRSIERERIGVPACSAGQSASFALRKVRGKDVHKGMVCLLKHDEQAGRSRWSHRT